MAKAKAEKLKAKGKLKTVPQSATLLDTKRPEIRTGAATLLVLMGGGVISKGKRAERVWDKNKAAVRGAAESEETQRMETTCMKVCTAP